MKIVFLDAAPPLPPPVVTDPRRTSQKDSIAQTYQRIHEKQKKTSVMQKRASRLKSGTQTRTDVTHRGRETQTDTETPTTPA